MTQNKYSVMNYSLGILNHSQNFKILIALQLFEIHTNLRNETNLWLNEKHSKSKYYMTIIK